MLTYFHRPKFPQLFERKKIIVRRISGENNSLIGVYDDSQFYTNDNLLNLILSDEEIIELQNPGKLDVYNPFGEFLLPYITGILCSKLMSYFFSRFLATGTLQGTYSGVYPEDLRKIPIRIASHTQQKKISELVLKITKLNKDHDQCKQEDEKALLEAEVRRVDAEIDNLIFQLYNISDEEMKVIEGSKYIEPILAKDYTS